MSVLLRNPQISALPLPFPFRGVLEAGAGVVLAITLEQAKEALGNAVKCFDLEDVADLAGDSFALGWYGGAGAPLTVQELDLGSVSGPLSWDLLRRQFQRVTLTAPTTITILPAQAAPGGSGHFQLTLFGTAANAVTWANIVWTGTGPDLTTAPVWAVNVFPGRDGVFRATATPFPS